MRAQPDHLAHIAAVRRLAGRELPKHRRAAEVAEAAAALAAATRTWTAVEPRAAGIEAAIAQADAVARALRELRAASLQPETAPA